jgi:hypothetical protein
VVGTWTVCSTGRLVSSSRDPFCCLKSAQDTESALRVVTCVVRFIPTKEENPDTLSGRITPKKLKAVKQAKLATVLGITQGRVSQLVNAEPNNYRVLRRYIQEVGRRDSILLLLQKEKWIDLSAPSRVRPPDKLTHYRKLLTQR